MSEAAGVTLEGTCIRKLSDRTWFGCRKHGHFKTNCPDGQTSSAREDARTSVSGGETAEGPV